MQELQDSWLRCRAPELVKDPVVFLVGWLVSWVFWNMVSLCSLGVVAHGPHCVNQGETHKYPPAFASGVWGLNVRHLTLPQSILLHRASLTITSKTAEISFGFGIVWVGCFVWHWIPGA